MRFSSVSHRSLAVGLVVALLTPVLPASAQQRFDQRARQTSVDQGMATIRAAFPHDPRQWHAGFVAISRSDDPVKAAGLFVSQHNAPQIAAGADPIVTAPVLSAPASSSSNDSENALRQAMSWSKKSQMPSPKPVALAPQISPEQKVLGDTSTVGAPADPKLSKDQLEAMSATERKEYEDKEIMRAMGVTDAQMAQAVASNKQLNDDKASGKGSDAEFYALRDKVTASINEHAKGKQSIIFPPPDQAKKDNVNPMLAIAAGALALGLAQHAKDEEAYSKMTPTQKAEYDRRHAEESQDAFLEEFERNQNRTRQMNEDNWDRENYHQAYGHDPLW